MTTFELALKNYSRGLWTDDMIAKLVAKGKLTSVEYTEITGKDYPESGEISPEEALNELKEVLA